MKKLLDQIVDDIKVEFMDKFDKNFQDKAFFGKPWKVTRLSNARGSLMMRTGRLRKSIRPSRSGKNIRFYSDAPYSAIHNEGGEIVVTSKMKAYFWYMHLKLSDKSSQVKTKQYQKRYNLEAEQWKALALKKVGSKINIDQRQFLGWDDSLLEDVQRIALANLQEHMVELARQIEEKATRRV